MTKVPRDVPCLIRRNLYLGSWEHETNAAQLKELGITHILQVGRELQPSHPDSFIYKHVRLVDTEEQDLISALPGCLNFVEQATYEGAVLVHCLAGVSRSASVVIAFLMWRDGLSYIEARAVVQRARPMIKPNEGFVVQLQLYEQLCCDAAKWNGWDSKQIHIARVAAGTTGGQSPQSSMSDVICY